MHWNKIISAWWRNLCSGTYRNNPKPPLNQTILCYDINWSNQLATSGFQNPPPSKWGQVHNLSCENEFYLHKNEKSFPCQRLGILPRFDTQARGISEMVYYVLIWFPLSMQGFSIPELRLLTPSVECECNPGRDGFNAFALEIRAFSGR